jgi:hypothetical protein
MDNNKTFVSECAYKIRWDRSTYSRSSGSPASTANRNTRANRTWPSIEVVDIPLFVIRARALCLSESS